MDFNNEEGYKNLRLRAWSDTKPIVDLNSILRDSHRTRIEMTPFKWCVYMNGPIDFCSPLLKEMVRRWVSRNSSFVLKQTMVPFTVGDVCMGLGLGVGGLDVNFDDDFDAVVCHEFSSKSFTVKDVINRIKHSKAVSNMPFRVLDNIDNLYQYNWAKAVHTFVLNSLGNASRKIRQGHIRDLGLSGNVAVLQLWAVERLGLADGAHDIVFPRIMNWRSLKLRCNKIEEMFKRKEICWEWFLRDEDRQNSMICAALHLEEGSIAEDDGDHLGLSWEQVLMKKIEDNQRKMVAMDKDLRSLATLVGVGKEDYEKGNLGKEEDGDVHGHGGAGQCFQTFTYSDVGGCCSGLKDDIEDVMDIGPVVSTVPLHDDTDDDNLLNVDRTQLYNMVIPFKLPWRVVSEISGQTFGTKDCYSFGPRMQVGNTGILFATSVFMFFERRTTGVVKRICFSPLYATHVLIESRKRKSNRKVWTLNDYSHYFQSNIIGFDDIVNAEFLFVPIIHDGHWWCYAVKIPSLEMFALDSFGHKRKERQKIDNVIAHNLALLFGHLFNCAEENKPSLEEELQQVREH
ncbi:uncharacterized protein LOC128195330 [Vigna angularis]|uniref:uncharacterized protein LOC128195330 n=1 Tax=Phaseolus angularis TaxID=3914 RepID=UPI0022B46615|nr:uncharacterized protein LOC128195330 [Vigna angularis]